MKHQRITPDWVIKEMVSMIPFKTNMTILEPGAGDGKIMDYIQVNYMCMIEALELNKEKRDSLIKKGHTIIGSDFLTFQPTKLYDAVIGAPPFGEKHGEHIFKMWECCKNRGHIVLVFSPLCLTNNEPYHTALRNWISTKKHLIQILPDMTFVEKKKNVPAAILLIYKD